MRNFSRLIPQLFAAFLLVCQTLYAQVEHIPIAHPIYTGLMRWEAQGILPADISTSVLPFQRKEIIAALKSVRRHDSLLSDAEKSVLVRFEREFDIVQTGRSLLFPKDSTSRTLLFEHLFDDEEKFFYFVQDSVLTLRLVPFIRAEARWQTGAQTASIPTTGSPPVERDQTTAILAALGGRISGTVSGMLGFMLQAQTGRTLGGTPLFLYDDPQLNQSFQFRVGDHRFFESTESHVRFEKDWFYAIGGREARLMGAGYGMRSLMSSQALPIDAVTLGARFHGFEYRATHFTLLGQPEPNPLSHGSQTPIADKYMAHHRFAFREAWGEIGFNELVIYSRRNIDLAYALPVSFIRNLTNDLRDRDNFQIALDATVRPLAGVQVKSTFLLDDLSMSKVGRAWWANKWAWNVGIMALPSAFGWKAPLDATLEYSRVEPYTYTHFDRQNAVVNDGILFAGHLRPNSDELMAQIRYWYGSRYPITLRVAWQRHGKNVTDANGALIRNVGGDPLQTLRRDTLTLAPIDSESTTFLDGAPDNRFLLTFTAGLELARQWNIQFRAQYALINGVAQPAVSFSLRFDDF